MRSPCPWDEPISTGTAQKVMELCNIDPHADLTKFRLLDFGCGNGRYLEVFASYIPKTNLYGTEVSTERVAQTRGKGFMCLQLGSEESWLPFRDESFDVVFSSNVIEHIPKRLYRGCLAEIHRVLKLRGRFVLGTPNYPFKRLYDMWKALRSEFTRYYLFDDPTHCNKMFIFRLERDLGRVFKMVHLEPTYICFQAKLPWLKKKSVRHRLRMFADKITGYCIR